MSISSIIVGGKDCPISKVISTLRTSSSFHLFHEKFSDVSIDLETPREKVKKIQADFLLDKITLVDVISDLLEDWVARNGSAATLQELVGILRDNHLSSCSESLEKAINDPAIFPTAYQKYSRIPPGVKDFLSNTDKPKIVCIIPTIDVSITCDKLRENDARCVIHDYDNLLKLISAKPLSEGCDPLYYGTIGSLKQLKKVLTEALDQQQMKTRLVVLTNHDNMEGLLDLFQSHANWEQVAQISIDPMKWYDLTLAHRNEIEKKMNERYQVELTDAELNDELCGQVIVDMINGNELNLFKDTFPDELSYYVLRTVRTRRYISFKIFNHVLNDIFLFTGMQRYELSSFVKDKLTAYSTNQIQQKFVNDVNYIILDHPAHFEKICQATNVPVHLLHFQNGRLKWLESRGGVTILQNNLEDSQDSWKEDKFCSNLDSNFPVVIADSPGMGKSVLLAQIGKMLISNWPERHVFFIVMTEFIKLIKKANIEEQREAARMCLQNLVCENMISKSIIHSKLNVKDNILIELLMDGFDELDPSDLELALKTLQIIKFTFKSTRLWITSRPHLLHVLENTFDTLGYTIRPFDEDDQIQFLTSYWSRNTEPNQIKLIQYAKECLKVLKAMMNSKHQDIAGIPLQCLLVGNVYAEGAIMFANSEQATFPTVSINSIANLYTAMIDKSFRKYRGLAAMHNPTETMEEFLMNWHVRFSLELIFPEHHPKLEYSFDSNHIQDILKVGLMEASSLAVTPKFIHRTFAEYLVACYCVDRLGTSGLIETFFEGVFNSHDSFSNNIGVDSFVFANPVVCYFIDSLLQGISTVVSYDNLSFSDSMNSEDFMQKMAHCCVNSDLINLFRFFLLMKMFDKHGNVIFNAGLLLLTIEKSSVEFVRLVLKLLEKHQDFDSEIKTASLSAAVRRGDYSIVEYLINAREFRLIVEEATAETRTILHDCVAESLSNSDEEAEQKVAVIRMIAQINSKLVEEANTKGQTPLLSKRVHVQLMIELINLNANVFAQDSHNDTVLHLGHGIRHLSTNDFHLLLASIPENHLVDLVHLQGRHGRTPLASLLEVMDPSRETLLKFMNAGADFNFEDETGCSIIEIAIKKGRNEKTFQALIECGTRAFSWRGKKGETVLHIAASSGNLFSLLYFISGNYNTNLNVKDVDGFTPLDYALNGDFKNEKRLETCMTLHQAGGKFKEIVNSLGQTWSHISAQMGNIQSIQFLLENGIDVNVMDKERNTPLHLLMMNSSLLKAPILELLLDHNANPNLLNKMGYTPLHIALMSDRLDIETFKLLKSKTNIEWTPSLANSALNMLIINGSDLSDNEFNEMEKEMEEHGADFTFKDEHGNSLLHIAIRHSHQRSLKLLLNKQNDVNVRNNLNQTPLHLLGKDFDLEHIQLLIENGADVSAQDKANETFLHLYIANGPTTTDFHSLVMLLSKNKLVNVFNIPGGGSEATPLQLAVKKLEILEATLSILRIDGADFNAVDHSGLSVLSYAVNGKRSVKFIINLIQYGVNWKALTRNKSSMLHFAADSGTPESLKFFLDLRELDVNGVNDDGDTPIHCAIAQRRKHTVSEKCKLLMDYGADVNISNVGGFTPFDFARLIKSGDEKLSCLELIHQSSILPNSVLKKKDRDKINVESIRRLTETGANVSGRDEELYTVLYNFVLQSNSLTPSEFHSVCEQLVDKNLTELLNIPDGKSGATLFQDAVRLVELEPMTLSLLHSSCFHFNAVDWDGNPVLFYAIRGKRSIMFLSTLVEKYGAVVTQVNNKKESLLHCSVHDGTVQTLKFFLDLGKLDVNGKNEEGLSPLHALVRFSEGMFTQEIHSKYKLLVDNGADVNSMNSWHGTPLHSSTFNRRKDVSLVIIKQLVEDGADVNQTDFSGATFLHLYMFNRSCPTPSEFNDMVEYLKQMNHINLFNAGDYKETTPFLRAIKHLEPEEKTLAMLHVNGVNFNTGNRSGNTILSFSVDSRRSVNFLYMLVTQFGVNPRNLNRNGDNLLHLLARYYSSDALKLFLDLSLPGLSVNEKDIYGSTPLHHAVQFGTEGVLQKCRLLTSHGTDLNSQNSMGHSPLHAAVLGKDKEVILKSIKFLIERGADTLPRNRNGDTFLHFYFCTKSTILSSPQVQSLVEYLLSKELAYLFNTPGGEYEQTPLQLMLRSFEPDMHTLSLLYSRGVNFNAVDKEGDSVLSSAVCGGRSTALLSSLINQFGANHKYLNSKGESILHTAAYFGKLEALKLFADFVDLDINGRSTNGNTPLICAAQSKSKKMISLQKCKMLISMGADVNIANSSHSLTFLHMYIVNPPRPTPAEFHDMVNYLIEKGYVDIFNVKDNDGATLILSAVRYLEPEEKTLSKLYSRGISFNTGNRSGTSILRYAVWGKRSVNFLYMLIIRLGVTPKRLNRHGDNLLHLLARHYSAEELKFFLDLSLTGLSVNDKNNHGCTPLHTTAQHATDDVLQKCMLLMDYGADINSLDNLQQTPLHAAALNKDGEVTPEIIMYFIEQGADIFSKDLDGDTFLHFYFSEESAKPSSARLHSLVEYLVENLLEIELAELFNTPDREFGQTPLQLMMKHLEPEMQTLYLLRSRGVQFNAVDEKGYTSLVYAVWGGRSTEFISNLVVQLAANYKYSTRYGESLLHTTSYFGTVDALKLFTDYGDLDINGRTTNGDTPIFYVLRPGNEVVDILEKCKLLVRQGADVTIANNEGHTPLSIAMESYKGSDKGELITFLQNMDPCQMSQSTPDNNTNRCNLV